LPLIYEHEFLEAFTIKHLNKLFNPKKEIMLRLQKISLAIAFTFCFIALNAQTDPYQNAVAATYTANKSEKITDARIKTAQKFQLKESYVSESFLNAEDGFIGIIFSEEVAKPNIYYKIVDTYGKEIYNGSAHANTGSQPTLYYNTQNLPTGKYRIFIENDDFFLSTSFIK